MNCDDPSCTVCSEQPHPAHPNVHDELGSDGFLHRVITNPNAMAIVKTSTFSPEYAELQRQFHIDRPDYGISGGRYTEHVQQLAQRLGTRDILDYGCGKATLQKTLPFPIQNYDPFVPEYSARPHPAKLVVCTDVMEHIELEHVDAVLADIAELTTTIVFFQIATRPASKILPDGRNAHLIQEQINWWLLKLIPHFNINAVQDLNGGFICVCTPLPKLGEQNDEARKG